MATIRVVNPFPHLDGHSVKGARHQVLVICTLHFSRDDEVAAVCDLRPGLLGLRLRRDVRGGGGGGRRQTWLRLRRQ